MHTYSRGFELAWHAASERKRCAGTPNAQPKRASCSPASHASYLKRRPFGLFSENLGMFTSHSRRFLLRLLAALSLVLPAVTAMADDVASDYQIKPGDLLIVNVWKEQDLTMEVLVRKSEI